MNRWQLVVWKPKIHVILCFEAGAQKFLSQNITWICFICHRPAASGWQSPRNQKDDSSCAGILLMTLHGVTLQNLTDTSKWPMKHILLSPSFRFQWGTNSNFEKSSDSSKAIHSYSVTKLKLGLNQADSKATPVCPQTKGWWSKDWRWWCWS